VLRRFNHSRAIDLDGSAAAFWFVPDGAGRPNRLPTKFSSRFSLLRRPPTRPPNFSTIAVSGLSRKSLPFCPRALLPFDTRAEVFNTAWLPFPRRDNAASALVSRVFSLYVFPPCPSYPSHPSTGGPPSLYSPYPRLGVALFDPPISFVHSVCVVRETFDCLAGSLTVFRP